MVIVTSHFITIANIVPIPGYCMLSGAIRPSSVGRSAFSSVLIPH